MSTWEYTVEGRLDLGEIKAQICSYAVEEETESAVSVDNYVLAYLLARPKHFRHTRWRVFGDDRIYQPSKLTLLPSDVPMLGYSAPARTRALLCEIDRNLFESVTGISEWSREQVARAMECGNTTCRLLFDRLAAEVLNPGFASLELSACLTRCLMIEIGRELQIEPVSEPECSRLADWQLRRIEEQIHDFSSDRKRIKISVLADSCGISDRHLMRSFKQATGTTIFRYMETVRLEETKSMLRGGRMPMKAIATKMGFSSSAHLSSAFKQLTGVTPSDYRTRLDS